MAQSERYPFLAAESELGEASFRPYMPITLRHKGRSVEAMGLLDTGAAINVLPYRLGIELGAVWAHQTASLSTSALRM